MIIENKRTNLVIIPILPQFKKTKQALKEKYAELKKQKKKFKFKTNQIVLTPGINEIPEKAWEEIRKVMGLDLLVQEGKLAEKFVKEEKEFVKGKDGEKKEKIVKKPLAFIDLDEDRQEELVADTYDLATLEVWRKSAEVNESVKVLIQEQMKKIKESKKDLSRSNKKG